LAVDCRGAPGVELGALEIVGVEANHREQSLAGRLTARCAQGFERRERLERALFRAVEVGKPVLDMS
jgi:hypothetical protein